MEEERISSLSVKVWNIGSVISALVWGVIAIALYIGLDIFTEMSKIVIVLISLIPSIVAIYYVINLFKLTRMLYESWYFSIGEEMIIFRKGIVIKERVTIPISRVQHVNTSQGPILKKFNLRDITINTAGGAHSIPCIENDKALMLQETIVISAERSRLENEL